MCQQWACQWQLAQHQWRTAALEAHSVPDPQTLTMHWACPGAPATEAQTQMLLLLIYIFSFWSSFWIYPCVSVHPPIHPCVVSTLVPMKPSLSVTIMPHHNLVHSLPSQDIQAPTLMTKRATEVQYWPQIWDSILTIPVMQRSEMFHMWQSSWIMTGIMTD